MEKKQICYSFINEADVMERLGGNINLFNRLFNKYINSYKNADGEVKELINKKNYEDARLLAHTIKGTSANLGITNMRQKAMELEKAIITEDVLEIEKRLRELKEELQRILTEINFK